MSLFADHNLPFAVALGLMLALAVLQIVGFGGVELDVDADIDVDIDFDASIGVDGIDLDTIDFDAVDGVDGAGGALDGLLSFFGIGRVPFMIWLACFLFTFAAVGVSVQALADSLTGAPLYTWLAGLVAGVAGLPVTGLLVRPLARILPQDETTAVARNSLVGRRARITTGRAAAGFAARASVKDHFGHTHHVMVEPHEGGSEMHEGDECLLVRRENGVFYGVALQTRRLAPEK